MILVILGTQDKEFPRLLSAVEREIINSGDNGFLIKNRNIDAMLLKIKNLIENEKLRKNVGKAARKSIDKYTSEVVGEEWFTLIEESDIYE